MVNLECSRTFLPKQRIVLEAKQKFPYYLGGFGSGKSLIGAHRIIRSSLENPGSVSLCGSQSYPLLRDSVVKTFIEELALLQKRFDNENIGIDLIADFNKTELKLTFFNGSEVLFRSTEDPSKFKSINLDFFWLDEPADIQEETFFMLVGRLRGKHTRNHFGVLTGNPSHPGHWLYKLYVESPPSADYLLVHSSSYENSFLPDGYVDSMEKSYSEDYAARYLRGEWVLFEGLVYSEFSRDVHVKDFTGVRHSFSEYWGGLDVGFRNPSCFLVLARDGDGNICVLEEFYESGKTSGELTAVINSFISRYGSNFSRVFVDPSASMVVEELSRAGVCAVGADNDVQAGVTVVKNLLHQNALRVDLGCSRLIHEIESYQYCKNRSGVFLETPLKKNDHAVDSLRYAVMGCRGNVGTSDFYVA